VSLSVAETFPKVSVFTPTYNHARYIREAGESVLSQDYPNLEIVIGDDGSTDGTLELLREFERRDPARVKLVLSPVNSGITANCNRTLAACDGEMIALFSGDDVWLPGKLRKQVEWFARNPDAVLCYTRVEVFDSDSGRVISVDPAETTDPAHLNPIELTYALGTCGVSFLVRREAIGRSFEQTIPTFSDWLFWIDILRRGRAGGVNEVLTRYRRHSQNASADLLTMFSDHLAVLALLDKRYPDLKRAVEARREILLSSYVARHAGTSQGDDFLVALVSRLGLRRTARAVLQTFARRLSKKLLQAR
jgi:glycosyltransferase involved in cell wall biosynthesis